MRLDKQPITLQNLEVGDEISKSLLLQIKNLLINNQDRQRLAKSLREQKSHNKKLLKYNKQMNKDLTKQHGLNEFLIEKLKKK
ncbi:MAG: hypothetical protein KAI79_12070 [Bacteroidales bacterium]|nr:hypothetical protein [Bacteroidales bacterium]